MNSTGFAGRLEAAIEIAALQMGAALKLLDYPNGGRDATFAETNVIAHLVHGLAATHPPFCCYAEAAHLGQRRIDLLGFDGETAFALEAKKFGHVADNVEALRLEMGRLDHFRPRLSKPSAGRVAVDWWSAASERWAVLLVASHAGDDVRDAWLAECAPSIPRGGHGKSWNNPAPVHQFVRELDARPNCVRRASHICDGDLWLNCADAWLLWAAYRLP